MQTLRDAARPPWRASAGHVRGLPAWLRPEQQTELAHTLLNEASAFTFLDAIDPAETALRAAIDLFAAAADSVNQGLHAHECGPPAGAHGPARTGAGRV
ncbi:MAG: hypothetical protein R2851_23175 [Caldilineaceae bacterium]